MTEYIFFGTFIAILSIYSEISGTKCVKALFCYLVALSLFLIGSRYYIGADWSAYKFFYENGYTYLTTSENLEIGFMIWNRLVSLTGVPSGVFFAITAFISLSQIYLAAKIFKIKNLSFVFLIYYCLFMASLQFNIIRTGLLGSSLILSLAYKSNDEKIKSLIWLVIGISMHYMGLLFIPVWYFIDRKVSQKLVILVFLISVLIFIAGVGRLINSYLFFLFLLDTRVSGYVQNAEEGYSLSVGILFNLMFFFYLWLTNKDRYEEDKSFRILLNTLMLSLLLSLALSDLSIFVARLGQVLNMSIIMLWPIFILQQKSMPFKQIRLLFISLFLCLYLWSYFSKSIGYGEYNSETSSYPYDYKLEQLYKKNQ